MTLLSPGSRYRSFQIGRTLELPELRVKLTEAEHLPTGAKILHLAAHDPENVFCISFRTEPQTSNGVAHILEHMVLCGSKRYPVRDPFMSMTRRSLHTFLNALTGADFTCYPGATLIPKDFYNLLDVYLDAVFQPQLRQSSFDQEGWRLEFETLEDASTPLCFRGVVFNEMKGAMASPESRCWKRLMAELYPDLTYRVNSGGDPADIPSLTVEELRAFHQHHYHPGRSICFFYGDLPLQGHLDALEPRLNEWNERAAPLPALAPQPRLASPKIVTEAFPAEQTASPLFALGWVTAPIHDVKSQLALELLQMVLMGTDASPLKRALMESGLCQDVDSMFEEEMSEAPFVLFFRGLSTQGSQQKAEKLTDCVLNCLRDLVKQGLPQEEVEGALDQLELQKLEITGDEGPFGMALFWRAVLQMQHGASPEQGLGVRAAFDQLRQSLKDPLFLPQIIQTWLLDNSHRVGLLMLPDREMGRRESRDEQARLRALESHLTDRERQDIVAKARALRQEQQAQQDISCLPSLELKDIPREVRSFALERQVVAGRPVWAHECFTNGIVNVDLVLPLQLPSSDQWPWLRLMAQMLPDLGWQGRSFRETLKDLLAYTGGFSIGWSLYPDAHDPSVWNPALCIRGKALERHAEKMLDLLKGMILAPDFSDLDRVRELVEQDWSHLETGVSRMANRLAHQLAAARVRSSAVIEVLAGGLSYVRWLQEQVQTLPGREKAFAAHLERMAHATLRGPAELIVTAEQPVLDRLARQAYQGVLDLPASQQASAPAPAVLGAQIPAHEIDGRVAFVAQAFATVPYTDPRSPWLAVASSLMENTSLHTEIRERGGAYGASASVHNLTGIWSFGSYRDPHVKNTSEAFKRSVHKLVRGEFSDQDVVEAQLSTLQSLDSLPAPGTRGFLAWRRQREGLTPKIRQAWKDGVLDVTRQQIMQAVEQVLLPQLDRWDPVVFAGKEVLEREQIAGSVPVLACRPDAEGGEIGAEEDEEELLESQAE
jgi:Zn-dependent M16 (insulinase) family peptidase